MGRKLIIEGMEPTIIHDVLIRMGVSKEVAKRVSEKYRVRGSGSALAELYSSGWMVVFNSDREEVVMRKQKGEMLDSVH